MEKPDYRAWFESTRESNQATIDQTETIFEGLVLKIASGAMAISFSFITALAPKISILVDSCCWMDCSCRVYYSEYPIIFKSKKKLPHKYSEY